MTGGRLPRTLVAQLGGKLGARVRLCGFAHELRAPTRVALRDHTGLAELRSQDPVEGLVPESAIEAVGLVEEAAAGGEPRLAVERLDVPGPALGELPLDGRSSLEERLDWRHLDLRRPRNRLIFEVQTTALGAMRDFWHERRLIELQSPKLRPIPNKSGASLFAVDYFGRPAYLAQSPQFYKQMAMAGGLDGIFEVGPVFRPQPERSSRHDTEFTSVDVELAWIDSMEDLLAFEEEMLRRVVAAVRGEHGDAVRRWFGVDLVEPSTPFPRVPFEQAREIVEATGWRGSAEHDLDAEGERGLAEHVARAEGHEFVYVTDYPDRARPFYHMRCSDDSLETRSFDLLWKGLEITSGAQREHRYERLVAQAEARAIRIDLIQGYLDYFRFGCPPHGGFGLGLTRMLMSMLDVDDVREVTYLFRGPDRLSP